MGVPSLFRTIVKKYPECYKLSNKNVTEHLYLDFNCLIHHCVAGLPSKSIISGRDLEEELITSVISYTNHIICDVVKPTKLAFIAFDGPVPMGKIVQQRRLVVNNATGSHGLMLFHAQVVDGMAQ